MNKFQHAIERKAFEKVLDNVIEKGQTNDVMDSIDELFTRMETILKGTWSDESFFMLHSLCKDRNGKWARYFNRLVKNSDPYVLKTFLLNAMYEGGFRGYQRTQEVDKENDFNVPWLILMDPTSACNMKCKGCWAAEYGYKQNLSYEDMDKVLKDAKPYGTHACLFTGGEPLVRKKDILRLCEEHRDVAFHAFTNGTLIDQEFCDDLKRVGNMLVSISVEGFEEANDSRRGDGHFNKVMTAMDLLKKNKIPFGVSICYTSKNYKVVTSDEFLDLLIEKGCYFAWYFHYMPVGMNASTDLLLNPEERLYMKNRIREIRGFTGGKELFAIDFQNDGEFTEGCIAGGRIYCHINAAGDVEPCVFIHYSGANIHDMSFIDCLKQPLFKAYRKGQPFNRNHLRPCPMLENPEILPKLVKECGAKSTDLEAPEPAEHLCEKCSLYAANWKPEAEKVWKKEHKN